MLWPYIPLTITKHEVLRYLGVLEGSMADERLLHDVQQCINKGKAVLHPSAVYSHVSIGELPVSNNLLKNCLSASVVAVTVGKNIEEQVLTLLQQGETTQGVILDAVATVAVEEAASRVVKILSSQHRVQGLFPTPMLAPGNNLAIEHLPTFLSLVGGEQIGIAYNEYFQMTPPKSLCFLIGWTTTSCQHKKKCSYCNNRNCQFRRVRMEGENSIVI